jgi:hypothetical protein
MKPLDYHDIYTDLPGYTTTGDYVEHFGMMNDTPMKTFLIIALVVFAGNHFGEGGLSPLNMLLYSIVIFLSLQWFKSAL